MQSLKIWDSHLLEYAARSLRDQKALGIAWISTDSVAGKWALRSTIALPCAAPTPGTKDLQPLELFFRLRSDISLSFSSYRLFTCSHLILTFVASFSISSQQSIDQVQIGNRTISLPLDPPPFDSSTWMISDSPQTSHTLLSHCIPQRIRQPLAAPRSLLPSPPPPLHLPLSRRHAAVLAAD